MRSLRDAHSIHKFASANRSATTCNLGYIQSEMLTPQIRVTTLAPLGTSVSAKVPLQFIHSGSIDRTSDLRIAHHNGSQVTRTSYTMLFVATEAEALGYRNKQNIRVGHIAPEV
jgi:hypothetical protein